MSHPHVWDEWIGPSPVRTLIAMECKASCSATRLSVGTSTLPIYKSTWPTDEQQHLYVHSLGGQPAAVVWLAGRAYLVGAPKGVTDSLRAEPEGILPSNIMLLNWAQDHTAGLDEYLEAYATQAGDHPKPCIWTSNWIWEHVIGRGITAGSAVETSVIDEPVLTKRFSPRISLSMTYGVGGEFPHLYTHFRFLDTHLILALDRIGATNVSPLGLPSLVEYGDMLSQIYQWYPGRTDRLDEVIKRRLKQLSDASILVPLTCERGSHWYHYSVEASKLECHVRPRGPEANGENGQRAGCASEEIRDSSTFVQEVLSRNISEVSRPGSDFLDCSHWNSTKASHLAVRIDGPPARAAKPDDDSIAEGHGTAPVSLVIGCGAPPTRWDGKLVPDRRLVLGERDVSVLEAKILQYAGARCGGDSLFSSTVYVFVSPATEAVVRGDLARLWREYKDPLSGASYRILRNRVIPRYDDRAGTYFRQEDGGFQYNPAGHFDLLWCLHDSELRGLFYYTNLTNMGIHITEDVNRIRQYLAVTKSAAVFELAEVKGEHGYGPGSYWIDAVDRKALIKPVYFGREGEEVKSWKTERDTVAYPGDKVLMSTGSVMLDAEAIRRNWNNLKELPFFARRQRPLPTSTTQPHDIEKWTVQFERDLDQMTWVKDVKCSGIIVPTSNGRRRFFAVKGESDLYQASYEELSSLYNGLRFFRQEDSPKMDLPPLQVPLSLEGSEQHDPWGDGRLRFMKGLPPADVPLSEEWSSSAYNKGMSRVERNALESQPLSDVDHDLRNQMNVMGKLLDCTGNLSIQIHPSQRVCEALMQGGHALEDKAGKEENFYVVRADEPKEFYLGLDAAAVFETFGRYGASQKGDPFGHIIAANADQIDEFGARLLDGLNTRFSEFLKDTLQSSSTEHLDDLNGVYLLSVRNRAAMPVTDQTLAGMLWILALGAVRKAVAERRAAKRADNRAFIVSYLNQIQNLEKGQIVHVPPGMVHAAGRGCCLVEASNQSDNTFRIYDFGREYERNTRPMHYGMAAVALSDESFLDNEKQKRLVYFPGHPHTARMISFDVLTNITESWKQCLNCQESMTHGHTVICAEGAVILLASSSAGTSGLRLRTAYSAYLRAGVKSAMVASAKHHISSCMVICSRSTEPKPVLAVEIGGTRVHFVHWAYPDAPQEERFTWYSELASCGDFSWQQRIEVFRRRLTSFLQGVRAAVAEQHILLGAVSWPGAMRVAEHTKDAAAGAEVELKARCLGNAITSLAELTGGIPGLVNNQASVMCDVAADIAAELKELGGKLQDENGTPQPGVFLNFATDVSMAVADGTVQPISLHCVDSNGRLLHIGRIGRMFWFDPLTRDWTIQVPVVEVEDPMPRALSPRAICLNEMLSTTGVVLRFLASEMGKHFLAANSAALWKGALEKCRSEARAVTQEDRAQAFRNYCKTYQPHLNAAVTEAFRWISEHSEAGGFVEEIGRDYGDMIAALAREFSELRDKRTVVLGGTGGAYFGKTESECFMATVNQEVGFHAVRWGGMTLAVERARASRSAHRLLHAADWLQLVQQR
jgi:mannose-6-phosphate isomerase class I